MSVDLFLAEAGLYFTQGKFEQAEAGFEKVLALQPLHPVASSGLFNTRWAIDTDASKLTAQKVIENFLANANRDDSEVKPVAISFIKIKIGLLQKDEWLLQK